MPVCNMCVCVFVCVRAVETDIWHNVNARPVITHVNAMCERVLVLCTQTRVPLRVHRRRLNGTRARTRTHTHTHAYWSQDIEHHMLAARARAMNEHVCHSRSARERSRASNIIMRIVP